MTPVALAEIEVVPTLADCEAVIERGQRAFVEVGMALMAIRDRRLYLETHATFREYVLARWGIGKSRAYQLIAAAQVSTTVDVKNERQARRLIAEPMSTTVDETTEEGPPEVIAYPDEWHELVRVMDVIEQLAINDAALVAVNVPRRRAPATAKKLRKLGTYLGRIAWLLEGNEDHR